MRLELALTAYGTDGFKEAFKQDIQNQPHTELPLQQGLTHSSYVSDEPFHAIVLSAEDVGDVIRVRTQIMYTGIIAGCACSDDPTPQDLMTESCVLVLDINKDSAQARVVLEQ